MAKTKIKELRDLSEAELKNKQDTLGDELLKLNQQRYAGNVEKPHLFRKIRKDIARIKTILEEKKSGIKTNEREKTT